MKTNVISIKSAHGKKCLPFEFLPPQASQAAPALHCQLRNRLCKYPISIQPPAAAALAPCLNKPCRVSSGGGGRKVAACRRRQEDQQLSWQIRSNLFASACVKTGFYVKRKSVISDPRFLSLFLLKYWFSVDLVERQCLLYQEWRETWEYQEGKEELAFLCHLQSIW